MYIYKSSYILINGKSYHFKNKIREVIKYKDTYIVLLEIPYDSDEINNIYCLDKKANIKWQSEDLSKKYPEKDNLPYDGMELEENIIYANDFFGRDYSIDAENGKILGYTIVK